MSDPLDPQGPYPDPLPDGTCTNCRVSDFTPARIDTNLEKENGRRKIQSNLQ